MKRTLAIMAISAACATMAAQASTPLHAVRTVDDGRMAPSADNVRRVRAALHAAATDEERLSQIRLLGTLHTRSNASGMNADIVRELQTFSRSTDRSIARAATFPLAQVLGAEEAVVILQRAKQIGLMDSNEIAGELARLLRFAPRDQQLQLVRFIAAERSAYGVDVLLMSGLNADLLQPMLPETRQAIGELLKHHKIDFPHAIGSFGYGDAIRYAGWLHASALVEASIGYRPYAATVLAQLDDPRIDPRKVIAYLSMPEGKDLMAAVGRRAPFARAVERANVYTDSFPGNTHVKALMDDILTNWKALK